MKIDLKTNNSNNSIKYQKIILYFLFFIFIVSLIFNSYLKINNYFNLKKEYEKLLENSNSSNDFQNKYNKKREVIINKKNNQFNWGMIFYNVYSKVPESVFITKVEYLNHELSITGTAKIKNDIFVFSEELKKIDFCSEVFIDDIKNEREILYTISILLNN